MFKSTLLCAAVALAAAGGLPPVCPPSFNYNIDYYGNDLRWTTRSNPSDCCMDCIETINCWIFTWYNGHCYLKGKMSQQTYCNGCVVGVMDAPPLHAVNPIANTTDVPKATAVFKYSNLKGSGSYNMVTKLEGCQKTSVATSGPIAPFHEDVSMVFRGPMDIYNIAVFQKGTNGWAKTSKYGGGAASNLVFMNNANPDKFNGKAPQGYASPDGTTFSKSAQSFSGALKAASDPSNIYGGPGIATGAEVNIMQEAKCTPETCKGFYDSTYGLQGWTGSKIFATKVKMGASGLPAIWMLHGQVVRANQYGCNCRGLADPGGCGELDIAEVLTPGASTLATHYYYLDTHPSPGHDTWANVLPNTEVTYVTILDEASGVIKVLQFPGADFSFFSGDSLSSESVAALLSQ
ncbi:hypothetical protein SPRG_07536 [Saprolegnia parasitica CBS 223.65]|uniref:glucan endo-1,3-beta-D-glucosidase n=1 Tax=Saprolegnia parasitica (strain CBS 223.65) TaxID=695850 RepID=A0A067CKH3_SAPPC|nr:hypothetical protein SPRG_07536 [Saprolegnia parasitica CBS 223.65]KDO27287.1 hypothetical protein SPRG_07536 [Saprolegnia parasitica CBS 223.65]|eukprot:XP_012202062.1 hypothetical protein SPRG_07536 [Saprolegnia parasitica CBS 223.65]